MRLQAYPSNRVPAREMSFKASKGFESFDSYSGGKTGSKVQHVGKK